MRARGRGGDDAAKTVVLEVMVALCVMVAAVAHVATFETSTSSFSPEQADLQSAAEQFLRILEDTPQGGSNACDGSTWLSHVAVDALTGKKDFFEERRSTLLSDKEVNLVLKNGRGQYPLVTEFSGIANAGTSVGFTPDDTFTLPISQVSGVGGQESLVVDTPAVRDGELFRLRGEAIEATIHSADLLPGVGVVATRVTHATGVTALPRADFVRPAIQDAVWLDAETGKPALVREPKPAEIAPEIQDPMRFSLRLAAAGGANEIMKGALIIIQLPPSWRYDSLADPEWTDHVEGDTTSGLRITLQNMLPLASPHVLDFYAYAPTTSTRPFDVIQAQLGNGSLTQAPFIVEYPAPLERNLPLFAYLTTPYPLTRGADADFGLVLANGGAATTVNQIDVTIPGGYDLSHNDGLGAPLFDDVDPVPLADTYSEGTWDQVDARTLRWTGDRDVSESEAVFWYFKVRITDDPNVHTALEGPASDGVESQLLLDNAHVATSLTLGPNVGILRQRVAPDAIATTATDGYAWSVGATEVEHDYLLRVQNGDFHVDAQGSYMVVPDSSDLVQMDSALANSTTRVSERMVPLGGVLSVETNLESMVSELAANGATSSTLKVDIYSPFSLGCEPTASWEREASSLPLAPINAMDVYDETGLGAPSTYLAAADGHVYRIDATGTLLWSRKTNAKPVAIDVGPAGVFVGESNGNITRLDMTLGETLWSTRISSTLMKTSPPVSLVLANATSGRVLVMSEDVVELHAVSNGAGLTRILRQNGGSYFVGAEWTRDGGVAYATTTSFGRADAQLSDKLTLPATNVVGLTATESGLIVTHDGSTSIYDLDTLDLVAKVSQHAETPTLTATGDATGDGVPDHLVARASLEVVLIDGRTRDVVVTSPPLSTWGSQGIDLGPISTEPPRMYTQGDSIMMERFGPPLESCDSPGVSRTLQDTHVCVEVDDPSNSVPRPLLLRAEGGRVLFAYALGALPQLYGWHGVTEIPFVQEILPIDAPPTDMWLGPWSIATRAYGWGDLKGTATMRPESPAPTGPWSYWTASPTEFVGQFLFNVGIPMGGFYGAHIVKMTLAWEDPSGGAREAHLVDWFHVVDVDGKPVAAPQYRVELSVRDPFGPMDIP